MQRQVEQERRWGTASCVVGPQARLCTTSLLCVPELLRFMLLPCASYKPGPRPPTPPAGGSVWCDDGRFPRRVLQPDWQGQPQEQCMCMPDAAVDGERRLYDGCSPEAARCRTSPPEEGAGEAEQ